MLFLTNQSINLTLNPLLCMNHVPHTYRWISGSRLLRPTSADKYALKCIELGYLRVVCHCFSWWAGWTFNQSILELNVLCSIYDGLILIHLIILMQAYQDITPAQQLREELAIMRMDANVCLELFCFSLRSHLLLKLHTSHRFFESFLFYLLIKRLCSEITAQYIRKLISLFFLLESGNAWIFRRCSSHVICGKLISFYDNSAIWQLIPFK